MSVYHTKRFICPVNVHLKFYTGELGCVRKQDTLTQHSTQAGSKAVFPPNLIIGWDVSLNFTQQTYM